MRTIAKVMAIAAALGAFPALAGPLDDRDPFSQNYTGRDPQEVRAEREQKKAGPCDMSCPCGHKHSEKGAHRSEPKN